MPALLLAAKNNHYDIAKEILTNANLYPRPIDMRVYNPINQLDDDNAPTLYYTIKNQNVDLMKDLLEKGAYIKYVFNKQSGFQLALETKLYSRSA